jgi:hypothetical protein
MGLVDGNMGRAPGLCSLGHRDPIPSIKKSTTLILLLKKKERNNASSQKKRRRRSQQCCILKLQRLFTSQKTL